MGAELLLSFRPGYSANPTTITLENIDLQNKIEELKNETAQKLNLPKEKFDLIYCGCLLEDDVTLESSGLKSGVMVHVIEKKEPEPPIEKKPISEETIQKLAKIFQTFIENPALRNAFYRLSKRTDVIKNIVTSSPQLCEDPVAIAMLQDPILMSHFSDVNTVKRIAEHHPVLIKVAQDTASAVHEEAHNTASTSMNSNSDADAFPFSLDALSDVEDMNVDTSQSESESSQAAPTGITVSQLAMALTRPAARGMPTPSSSSSSSRTGSNSGFITSEMFSQAMQQAFASTQASSGASSASPIVPPVSDMQRQLALMHEMGLQDDTVNIQALQFVNGDVQAAIELVFSGFNN